MSWNHRILAFEQDKEIYFEIHRVFYDENKKPWGYAIKSSSIGADNIKGISWVLDKMKDCTKKPILWGGDKFPEEYKKKINEQNIKHKFMKNSIKKIFDFSRKMTAKQFENNLKEIDYMNELKEFIKDRVEDIFLGNEFLTSDNDSHQEYYQEYFKLENEEYIHNGLSIFISGRASQSVISHNSFDEPPYIECSNKEGSFKIEVYNKDGDKIEEYSYEYPEDELIKENEFVD